MKQCGWFVRSAKQGASGASEDMRPTAGSPEYEGAVAAARWYFLGDGRRRRIASFFCHLTLLALLTGGLLMLVDGGSVLWSTIVSVNADSNMARHAAMTRLGNISALDYIRLVENVLRQRMLSQCLLALVVALCLEARLTLRRAQRQMPPAEFLTEPGSV